MKKTVSKKATKAETSKVSDDHAVHYIIHPAPPNAKGERNYCAHVVANHTYSFDEMVKRVAERHALIDAPTARYVMQAVLDTAQEILQEGGSVAFKNYFTIQLSIAGTLKEGEHPDPKKGHQLRPRIRIAPAFINAVNENIQFKPLEDRK